MLFLNVTFYFNLTNNSIFWPRTVTFSNYFFLYSFPSPHQYMILSGLFLTAKLSIHNMVLDLTITLSVVRDREKSFTVVWMAAGCLDCLLSTTTHISYTKISMVPAVSCSPDPISMSKYTGLTWYPVWWSTTLWTKWWHSAKGDITYPEARQWNYSASLTR